MKDSHEKNKQIPEKSIFDGNELIRYMNHELTWIHTREIKRLKRAHTNFFKIIFTFVFAARRCKQWNSPRSWWHSVNSYASNTSTHIPGTVWCRGAVKRARARGQIIINSFISFFLFKVKYYVVMNSDKDELPKCFFFSFFFSFSMIYFHKYHIEISNADYWHTYGRTRRLPLVQIITNKFRFGFFCTDVSVNACVCVFAWMSSAVCTCFMSYKLKRTVAWLRPHTNERLNNSGKKIAQTPTEQKKTCSSKSKLMKLTAMTLVALDV